MQRLLEDEGIEVVAAVADAAALTTAVLTHRPDAAIIDIRLPPSYPDAGLRAATAIRRTVHGIAVLILSQYVEERYAHELLDAGTAGVGYQLKHRVGDVEEFLEVLHRIARGGTVLDPEVVTQLLRRRRRDALDVLTAREREVLTLMAEGRSNTAIAQRLALAERTVEKHITAIFTKLDLAESPHDHRRVLAVLTYLRGDRQPPR